MKERLKEFEALHQHRIHQILSSQPDPNDASQQRLKMTVIYI